MKISVVVPCYNEEESIALFYNEIILVAKEMDYEFEFIFINFIPSPSSITLYGILAIFNTFSIIILFLYFRNQ